MRLVSSRYITSPKSFCEIAVGDTQAIPAGQGMYQGRLSVIRSQGAPGVLIARGGAPMVSMQYPDTGPGRGGPGASGDLIACPECELPAEITERFWLNSTDGPILHFCVICVDGHYFRMPADGLRADPGPVQVLNSSPADQPATPVGFVRMPGRLGTVGNPLPDGMRDEEASPSLA